MSAAGWLRCACLWLLVIDADAAARITASTIAWDNLEAQIDRAGDSAAADALWQLRWRLLHDPAALRRIARHAAAEAEDAAALLRRARHRAALHQFVAASTDLVAAVRMGAAGAEVEIAQAMLLVARGRAHDALPRLRARIRSRPDAGSMTTLAHACAAAGLPRQADRWYGRALRRLDTSLPFAYAELYFARGLLWSEQVGDRARGARMYRRALGFVPEFVAARIHLAELEQARGKPLRALQLINHIGSGTADPEALALGATLRTTLGLDGAEAELAAAHRRFAELSKRYPLAYADHAARFHLGPGNDPQQALAWARLNLANRPTPDARALARAAAQAAGQPVPPVAAAVPELPHRLAVQACSGRLSR